MPSRDSDITNNLKDPERQLRLRNSLFKTIKNLNQALIRVKSKRELLKDLAKTFSQSKLFNFAFIITLDKENKPKNILTDEFDNSFISNYANSLKNNTYPDCLKEILRERQSIILEENMHICGNCNFSDQTNLKSLILFPIVYENNFYGI
ncbi:MAG: hypothetical protein GF317_18675, partial [Candidatus Lokiarchaeota archaeon]|nr:hypothetical protein [Candidatus Lokiarchaeota archaeon]MBD3201542.1 hypothetical protein [Candidatus Lokiarchaeota archaeon]